MKSFLGVPVMAKGRILGNFYLADKLGADEFTAEDEDLIVGLAAFAAVAIENARLYTETDTRLRRKMEEVLETDDNRETAGYGVSQSGDRGDAGTVPDVLGGAGRSGAGRGAACLPLLEGSLI